MSIKIGSQNFKEVYVGDKHIQRAYVGDTMVFDSEPPFPVDGLQHYYSFDVVDGVTVYDTYGNADGEASNIRIYDEEGKYLDGADFSKGDDYIDFGNRSSYVMDTSFTIVLWQKRTTSNNGALITKGYDLSEQAMPWYLSRGNTNVAEMYFRTSSNANHQVVGIKNVADGEWHQIIWIYNKSDSTLKQYVDGQLDGSISNVPNESYGNNNNNLVIGRHNGVNFTDAVVDELAMYNRALDEEEVTFLYNAGEGRFYIPPPVAVTGVTLNENTLDIVEDDTFQLTATVSPANAHNKNVVWSSSDETILTVDQNGLVTAVGDVDDTATITVTTEDGGFTDTCEFTVIELITFIQATGGNISFDGDYKIHSFTSNGTFEITELANKTENNEIEYLIVAGGGRGGSASRPNNGVAIAGGGGAGGVLQGTKTDINTGSYSVVRGAGGTSGSFSKVNGEDSSVFGLTAVGGGAGGSATGTYTSNLAGVVGGSGGGAAEYNSTEGSAANGTSGQGNRGGSVGIENNRAASGKGGGAGGVGGAGTSGGEGIVSSITGTAITYAVGGNGTTSGYNGNGGAGTNGRGNGGGGARRNTSGSAYGGSGGSGIVILRYKYK